jgi:hypothetical protein
MALSARTNTVILLTCTGLIACSSLALPWIFPDSPPATFLFFLFGAAILRDIPAPHGFAETHFPLTVAVSAMLNSMAFLLVAAPLWLMLRRRAPAVACGLVVLWAIVYMTALFFLYRTPSIS